MRYTHVNIPEVLTGLILILGWFPVSIPLNIATACCMVYLLLAKKQHPVKAWLQVVNLFFLVTQFVYYIVTSNQQ
ncbi:hypothetical protein [Deminuibacter soli]|uniref:hypothetical protein n=1 Tax=Deminuibacter soli TaxID=2291815 RepID=UPI0011C16320|nr:hypothetical protein [Deminuibacter soli]